MTQNAESLQSLVFQKLLMHQMRFLQSARFPFLVHALSFSVRVPLAYKSFVHLNEFPVVCLPPFYFQLIDLIQELFLAVLIMEHAFYFDFYVANPLFRRVVRQNLIDTGQRPGVFNSIRCEAFN